EGTRATTSRGLVLCPAVREPGSADRRDTPRTSPPSWPGPGRHGATLTPWGRRHGGPMGTPPRREWAGRMCHLMNPGNDHRVLSTVPPGTATLWARELTAVATPRPTPRQHPNLCVEWRKMV